MEFLSSGTGILLGILGIGFVIFIHELGHFLAAKWAGVRVDTFSIGFGPVIVRKTVGETDYVISLLPFGGYVAMQQDDDGSGSGRSMAEKNPWWRAAVLFAGVFFNLVSSYLLLLFLAWYGMPHFPPIVGDVQPQVRSVDGVYVDSPAAQLPLLRGDKIISYNGQAIRSFEGLVQAITLGDTGPIEVVVQRGDKQVTLPNQGQTVLPVHDESLGRLTIGCNPAATNLIGAVGAKGDSPVEAGWRVVAVDGQDLEEPWAYAIKDRLATRVGDEVTLTLVKGDQRREATITYAGSRFMGPAMSWPVSFQRVFPDGAASEAGVKAGDVCLRVDGEPIASDAEFIAALRRKGRDASIVMDLLRWQGTWQPVQVTVRPRWDERYNRVMVGVAIDAHRYGDFPAVAQAIDSEPVSDETPEEEAETAEQGRGDDGADSPGFAESTAKPGPALLRDSLQAGDFVIGYAFLEHENGRVDRSRFQVLRIKGGRTHLLAFDDEAWKKDLLRRRDPPVLAKFLGARTEESVASRLNGSQVLGFAGTDAELLRLRQWTVGEQGVVSSNEQTVLLSKLPERVRSLFETLEPGDWLVAGGYYDADGQRGFAVRRGASVDRPEMLSVAMRDPGVAINFRLEEVPLELASWTDAFGVAAWASWDMVAQTGKIISRFFVGSEQGGVDASKALHGPIGIFSELKARHDHSGFASFLKIIALLGLNLFLINLIPVPITDGGQLLQLGVEQIIRRPIPPRVINAINMLGFLAIVTLMLFVVGVDILRLAGRH